jgi:HK97 family phage prohead protease
MPYSKPSEAPDYVPDGKKAQWVAVFNSAWKKAKADGKSDDDAEASAFAQANGVAGPNAKSLSAQIEMRHSVNREVRMTARAEIRARKTDKGPMQLEGYAAMFGVPIVIRDWLGEFTEVVNSGCFSRCLEAGTDVRALFNHDVNCVLGRSQNNTLRLSEDQNGLHFEIDLPDTQVARDVHTLVMRGDISQCSITFEVIEKEGQKWIEGKDADGNDTLRRELIDVKLYDISPVTFPACPETGVDARSLWPEGEPESVLHRADARMAKTSLDDIARKLRAIKIATETEFSRTR